MLDNNGWGGCDFPRITRSFAPTPGRLLLDHWLASVLQDIYDKRDGPPRKGVRMPRPILTASVRVGCIGKRSPHSLPVRGRSELNVMANSSFHDMVANFREYDAALPTKLRLALSNTLNQANGPDPVVADTWASPVVDSGLSDPVRSFRSAPPRSLTGHLLRLRRIWRKPELSHQGHGVVILAAVNDLPVASPSDKAELHLDLPARRRDRTGRNLKSAVLPSVCDRLDNRPVPTARTFVCSSRISGNAFRYLPQ